MITNNLIIALILNLLITSSNQRLPENYGIYISSNHDLITLNPQKTLINGNLLESISGLKKSSGLFFQNFDYIIVFEQNINPEDIKISKLEFNKGSYVRNLFENSYVELNLYTSRREIPLNIAPIESKKDMYKITTNKPLDSGFYALHFGCLTNQNTPEAFNKVAYDFVIGSSTDAYQSYDEIVRKNEQIFTSNAEMLLFKINDFFNKKDYDQIHKIYIKTDGSNFNDEEWKSLKEGFDNWILLSGKIKSSTIIDKRISDNYGTFSLQTEYEKLGSIQEELRIMKKDGLFFITFIGSD